MSCDLSDDNLIINLSICFLGFFVLTAAQIPIPPSPDHMKEQG